MIDSAESGASFLDRVEEGLNMTISHCFSPVYSTLFNTWRINQLENLSYRDTPYKTGSHVESESL